MTKLLSLKDMFRQTKMLITMNGDNKMNVKRDIVRIIKEP